MRSSDLIGMDIHFGCTQCGKCCRDTKVPLTVAEAIKWLNRGDEVQLLCEAPRGRKRWTANHEPLISNAAPSRS